MCCALDLDDNTLVAVALVGLLIGVSLVRAIVRAVFSVKPPPTFRCARCHRESPHDHRTIEAWRSGKRRIFCPDCHRKWRETHPAVRETSGAGGCLIPFALILAAIALGVHATVRAV